MKLKVFVAVGILLAGVVNAGCSRRESSGGIAGVKDANFHEDKAPLQATTPSVENTTPSNPKHPLAQATQFPPQIPQQKRAYLASESRLLRGSAVSAASTFAALRSKRFDQIAQEFAKESASDPNAQELTDTYRASIQRDLGKDSILSDFACGLSLCIGAIRSHGENGSYRTWSDSFFENPRLPNYNFTEFSMPLGGGDFENRFLFSMDPGVSGVTAPLHGSIVPKP